MTNRKAGKAPAADAPDYFEKLLEKPCTNHPYRVNHLLKDCGLMKKWLSGNLRKGERKKPEVLDGGEEEKDEAFPEHDVLMIFGGPAACESKRKQKTTR